MKKRQLGPCVTFFPQPTTLITTVGDQGLFNVMTASWAGIVSKTPPTMGISLHHGRQTLEQIEQSGCFVVNVVPASLAVEADYCGIRSGRDADKAKVAGLTLEPGTRVTAPLVVEAPLNVECRLEKVVELGDYRLVLGGIVEIHAADHAFDADGNIDAKAFDPLVYLGGIREYWSLGEKRADAYKDGRKLLEKE